MQKNVYEILNNLMISQAEVAISVNSNSYKRKQILERKIRMNINDLLQLSKELELNIKEIIPSEIKRCAINVEEEGDLPNLIEKTELNTTYSEMLKRSIKLSGYTLNELSEKVKDKGIHATREYISRLQNGKGSPGGDNLNKVLAELLGMDEMKFKAAAHLEKIPDDVFKYLINQPQKSL